ncbi:MAG: hypothetical protein Q7K35_01450 [bacterium]|nr:hypothetical protein [bacterium]
MPNFFKEKSFWRLFCVGFFSLVFFLTFFSQSSFGAGTFYCNFGEPDKCNPKIPNLIITCGDCDADPDYEWCNTTNCAATGRTCRNGFCQGASSCIDTDKDGYGATGSTGCPKSGDCNNNNPAVHPYATKICGNGVDEDCLNGDLTTENWSCGNWSACSAGQQTRTCIDANSCGTTANKPTEAQDCLYAAITNPNTGFKTSKDGPMIDVQAVAYGGKPPYNYAWKNNNLPLGGNLPNIMINPLLLNVGNQAISLEVTDANAAVASNNIVIEVLPAGSLTAQIMMLREELPKSQPANFSAIAQGGVQPYAFLWNSDKANDFSNNQWPLVDISGWALGEHIIKVTVTDSAGQTAVSTHKTKIVDLAIRVNPAEGRAFDFGSAIPFSAMITGGILPHRVTWLSNRDGDFTPQVGNTINFQSDKLSVGVHTITVTATDNNLLAPLTASKQIHIQINSAPALGATIIFPANNSSFAQGNNIAFQANVTGGVEPKTYTWSSNIGNQIFTSQISPNFNKNNLAVGNHLITFTVRDNAGQTVNKTVNLTVSAPTGINVNINTPASNSNFYNGDSLVHFTATASGGVSPYAYQWSSSNGGNLSAQANFYTSALAAGNHLITLSVRDQNNTVQTANINLTVNSAPNFANTKNPSKYAAKESFLISHKNWQDVLSLTPIAVWPGNKYPLLVYHEDSGGSDIDIDSTINFLQMSEPNHLTTVGATHWKANSALVGAKPFGAGLAAGNISNISPSDYFSYWQTIKSLVLVDRDNYQAGLIGALLASYKNAPLIFINSTNLAAYQTLINGKVVYTVGGLDAATNNFINTGAGVKINYSIEELQRWYINKTNTDKIILVDSSDLNADYAQPAPDWYSTDKGGTIYQLLQRLSLAAPYLAAAKGEVILFNNNSDLDKRNDLFPTGSLYLTIMSSGDKISENLPAGSYYKARITGISSADTFSYAARAIFYEELFNKFYPNPLFNKFYISANLSCNPDQAIITQNNSAQVVNSFSPNDYTYNSLIDKQFNIYFSHGNAMGWSCGIFGGSGLNYNNIPYLNLSWGSAGSCSTGKFAGVSSFSYNWLRKGGIAYWGAREDIGLSDAYLGTDIPFSQWQANPNIDLGHLAANINPPLFAMYGDPTLVLAYRGGANKLPINTLTVNGSNCCGNYQTTISRGNTAYLWCTAHDYDGSITKYEIDYDGDGVYDNEFSAGATLSHVYNTSGAVKPRCRATDNNGGQAITTAVININ